MIVLKLSFDVTLIRAVSFVAETLRFNNGGAGGGSGNGHPTGYVVKL